MRIPKRLTLAAASAGGLYTFALYRQRRFEDLTIEEADPPGQMIDVDGVRVHYVEAGSGEPVVLVHGLWGSTFSFRYTIPELAQHFRVVALDLNGFGYSERDRGGMSLNAQADLVAGVMRSLGIDRATVVGHSMGGNVALRLATRQPERVSRLVLVDPAQDVDLRRGRAARPLSLLLPLFSMVTLQNPRFRRRALRSVAHDPAFVTAEVEEGYYRPFHLRGSLRAMGRLMRDRKKDEPIDVSRVGQPTLILWGEHDKVVSPVGDQLTSEMPDARLEWVRSAAHVPLEEQPELSNRLLLRFLLGPEAAAPVQPLPRSAAPST